MCIGLSSSEINFSSETDFEDLIKKNKPIFSLLLSQTLINKTY